MSKECNMCKLSYTPLLSSLIIFCEMLCYLNGNSLCVIKNDSFQRQNVLHIKQKVDQQNLGQHGEANLSQQYCTISNTVLLSL